MAGRRLLRVWIVLQFLGGLVFLATVAEPRRGQPGGSAMATDPVTPLDDRSSAALHPLVPPAVRSTTAPRPQYPVTGRVTLHDGRSVADAKVVLVLDGGLLGGLGAVIDAGFGGCGAPDLCYRGREARTDRAGRFEFMVTAGAAQQNVLVVAERGYKSTATSTLRTTLTGARQDVGTIPLWEPKVTFGPKGASWSPAPPNGAKGNLFLTQDVENSITFEGDEGGAHYDHRVLEDFTLEARVIARGGNLQLSSPPVQVRGPARPASRARPCVVSDPGPPTLHQGCPWTSGRIRVVTEVGTTRVEGNVMDVDLGAEQPVNYLVLRGSTNVKEVQISDDRTNWQQVQLRNDVYVPSHSGYSLLAPAAARWVRIRWATFGVDGLDGLSLWT